MTNEEAKIIIGNIPIKPEVLDDCYDITEYQEAKAMAIKALEQTRWIPKGATNGNAIIALYPNLRFTIHNDRVVTNIGVASSFDLEWWNAPYREGDKE